MSDLQTLLDKFAALHRRQVELQYEIAAVTGEIFALGRTSDAPKKRRKRTATADIAELVRPIVKALQQAGEHRRSNVESVMWMLKSKFGAAVRSKTTTAQVNEVLAKCVLHNLCCIVQAIFTADLAPKFWQDAAPKATRPTLTLVQ